ncbi:MAG: radical SAM/SPASM domain-containing protein [Candidatus Sumerlaeota bacterium]|nr:radical SAM/SPASM domain-containing protein [Candidatus Sumerlaeota bacterium]
MPYNMSIHITGYGEPTMSSRFDELLDMALANGSETNFFTNASLLNFARLERLTRCPVNITLSIDGATKATYESVRQGSNFDRLLDKLAMIKKMRDIHLSESFARFGVCFVSLRDNLHELADVVRLARRFRIDAVGAADYALQNTEFDRQSPRYDPRRANRCLEEARNVARELGVPLQTPPSYDPNPAVYRGESIWRKLRGARKLFSEPNRFPRRCHSPWSEPYIHTDGRVVPCCASNVFLGDLSKDSFATIWNGWRYRLFRWSIRGSLPPLDCRNCFVMWGINGGNAGNAIAKEGLLVKAWYYAEARLRRLWESLAHRIRRALQPGTPVYPPPNFDRGRPIRSNPSGAGQGPPRPPSGRPNPPVG